MCSPRLSGFFYFLLGVLFHAVAIPQLVPLARAAEAAWVARVNGTALSLELFLETAARKAPQDGESLSPEERMEVVDKLVDEELLYQEALAKGYDKDPKVKKVMVSTLLRAEVYAEVSNADFTDEALEAYYNAHKEEFVIPEKVQIKHILIRVTEERTEAAARAIAADLYAKVMADPAAFKDIAAEHSEDPYRRRGGDVGFVSREGKPGLDPLIVDTAFTLNAGQIAPPVRTSEGYSVIMTAARREQVERTFQQMKGSVLRKVKNEALSELYEAHVASLRSGAKVQVNQRLVESVEIAPPPRPFYTPDTDLFNLEDGALPVEEP